MKDTAVINLFGGPGTGKTTLQRKAIVHLSEQGYDVEEVKEFAKDLTWEENYLSLADQPYISGMQHHREFIKLGKTDCIITDSPIILGIIYSQQPKEIHEAYENYLMSIFKSRKSLNILIQREGSYQEAGRNETLEEAIEKDKMIENLLTNHEIPYIVSKRSWTDQTINEIEKFIQPQ